MPSLSPHQLHTRIGMAQVFANDAPTNALARVLRNGECEMLGGFSSIPPSGRTGWICRVKTRNGRARFLAIIVDQSVRLYRVNEIKSVPWESWDGHAEAVGWSPSSGDTPRNNAESHRIAVALHEALRVDLSVLPKPTTGGTSAHSGVAEVQASSPHIWDRALKRLRRNQWH